MDKQSTTLIYGLIGYPVRHSLSPQMHNAAFRYLNIDAEYRLFGVKPEELEGFLQGTISVKDVEGNSYHSKHIVGFNITIPHKVGAFILVENTPTLLLLDTTILLANSINTVKRKDGKLDCRNTDITGFVKSLQEDLKFNCAGKSILLFGCGGAGRAVVAGLLQEGMNTKRMYLYDINKEAMESTKRHFLKPSFADFVKNRLEFISKDEIPEKIARSELLVNATPIGLKEGDGSVIDKSLLHKNLHVYDLVYNRETQLIKDAKSQRVKNAVDGRGMLLYQGAAAFTFWTGKPAPIEVMRQALNKGAKLV